MTPPEPEVDPETLRGVTIAVTGKIRSSGGIPQITIKSTNDIQARSALQTNYIGHAYDKETKGDTTVRWKNETSHRTPAGAAR